MLFKNVCRSFSAKCDTNSALKTFSAYVLYKLTVELSRRIKRTNSFDQAIKDPFHLMFLIGPSP